MIFKKKSLGQNFLTSPHYAQLIADSAHIVKGESVFEVGPGEGMLTRALLARGARVVAVEKDSRLIPILRETFAREINDGKLELIEGDALDVDLSAYLPREYKIVANIPYYITGALMRKFLSAYDKPSLMVLLVQKEVAQRIARDKKESILSLSVKAYGTPKYVKTVPRGAFSPKPAVDSAILAVYDINNPFESEEQEKNFFDLLHAGFGKKRKLLARNLEQIFGKDENVLELVGVPDKARAEDVPLDKWLLLSAK